MSWQVWLARLFDLAAVTLAWAVSFVLRYNFDVPPHVQETILTSLPWAVAVHAARELRSLRIDGLGHYLEARQLMNANRFKLAVFLLDAARNRGLPTVRLRQEARRLLGVAYFASGELSAARGIFQEIQTDPETSLARRGMAADWLERIGP